MTTSFEHTYIPSPMGNHPVWLNLTKWFWRSRKCYSLQTDRQRAIRKTHLNSNYIHPIFDTGTYKLPSVAQFRQMGPRIKFCLFPLSDRPTKIAATQEILLPRLMKNYVITYYFHYLLNIDQQTSTLIKNIAYEWSLLSAILIIEGKNKIFFLLTYP
jgi:hypothetical protein